MYQAERLPAEARDLDWKAGSRGRCCDRVTVGTAQIAAPNLRTERRFCQPPNMLKPCHSRNYLMRQWAIAYLNGAGNGRQGAAGARLEAAMLPARGGEALSISWACPGGNVKNLNQDRLSLTWVAR